MANESNLTATEIAIARALSQALHNGEVTFEDIRGYLYTAAAIGQHFTVADGTASTDGSIAISAAGNITYDAEVSHAFGIDGTTVASLSASELELHVTRMEFDSAQASGLIRVEPTTTASATGVGLSIVGQVASGATSTGGAVAVRAGTGTSTNGVLTLEDADGTAGVTIGATQDVTIDSAVTTTLSIATAGKVALTASNIQIIPASVQFDDATAAPFLRHQVSATATTGAVLTLAAQALTTAAGAKTAGALLCKGGDCADGDVSNTGGASGIQGGTGATAGGSATMNQADGTVLVEVDDTGIGFFAATPVAAQAITGALSTVADAPAKAVLTSIIAAGVALGLITDSTT